MGSAPLDLGATAANISILVLFIGAIIVGIARGLKEIRGLKPTSDSTSIAGATILENVTLREWTASNIAVAKRLEDLVEAADEHRRTVRELTDELRATRHELNTLNHSRNRG